MGQTADITLRKVLVVKRPTMADNSGSDSGSAPEDVSFQTAKDAAMETIKQAARVLRDEKDKKREQRKRKQEFFQEQKMKKMARMKKLEKKKLPDTFLENLPCSEGTGSEASTGETQDDKKDKNVKINNNVKKFPEVSENLSDAENDGDSFIPLKESSGTQFSVMSLKDVKSRYTASASAAEFRNKMLFGSRVRREPVKNRMYRQQKLVASGKTSFVGR